jgi:hypothetical protein
MKFNIFRLASAASTLLWMTITLPAIAAPIKNIVLVHGAFVDGSGWRPVYNILIEDGYNVSLVQEPLTSFTFEVRIDNPVHFGDHVGKCADVRIIPRLGDRSR